ncbi:hypothetical protein ACH41H_24655 [Streptomyces sp. NPDC020800]|uniref:hypothetical protein n=1 Tax=Streptomyces sp. NPDC020800 TaxID=3365092 RepID=UPI0037ACF13A
MPKLFASLRSPLRRIDADPDQLVLEAHELLLQSNEKDGVWVAMSALSSKATAKIALANYLREHRDS